MPNTDDDLSFFIYGDSITTDAFDNAQNTTAESGDGSSMGDGATNMGDAGSSGICGGEGGTSTGNSASAGMGM